MLKQNAENTKMKESKIWELLEKLVMEPCRKIYQYVINIKYNKD